MIFFHILFFTYTYILVFYQNLLGWTSSEARAKYTFLFLSCLATSVTFHIEKKRIVNGKSAYTDISYVPKLTEGVLWMKAYYSGTNQRPFSIIPDWVF